MKSLRVQAKDGVPGKDWWQGKKKLVFMGGNTHDSNAHGKSACDWGAHGSSTWILSLSIGLKI